ncbi:MAG: hypothetical protein ACKVOE_01385 [Rickettsiales bacterium]
MVTKPATTIPLTDAARYASALAQLGRPLSQTEVALLNPQTGKLEVADLNGIASARLGQLRTLLPAGYQEQSRQISQLLENFQSTSTIELPNGLTWEAIFGAVGSYVKKPAGEAYTQAEKFIDENKDKIEFLRAAVSAGTSLKNGASNTEAFFASWNNGANASQNFFGIGRQLDIIKSTIGARKLTKAQCDAVADTIALATYQSVQSNGTASAALAVSPGDAKPNFIDNVWSLGQRLGSLLVHALPAEWGQYVLQWANYAYGGFKDWDAAGVAAKQALANEPQAVSWDTLAKQSAQERVRKAQLSATTQGRADAAEMLAGVSSVEGVTNVPGIAKLVAEGGPFRGAPEKDANGKTVQKLYLARYVNGTLQKDPILVTGPDGKQRQMTVADEQTQASANMAPVLDRGVTLLNLASYAGGATTDAALTYGGAALAMTTGYGMQEGFLRQTLGGHAAAGRSDHLYNGKLKLGSQHALEEKAEAATKRADALKNGARRWPWERTEAQYREQADEFTKKAAKIEVRSDHQLKVAIERNDRFIDPKTSFSPLNAHAEESLIKGSSWFEKARSAVWNSPRIVGRWMGDGAGKVTDFVAYRSAQAGRFAVGLVEKLPGGEKATEAVAWGVSKVAPALVPVAEVGGRLVAPVGAAVGVGQAGYDVYHGVSTGEKHHTIKGVASFGTIGASAMAGFWMGAGGGTLVLPVIGTIGGGVVGAIGGAATGALAAWGGGMVYDKLDVGYQMREAERNARTAEMLAKREKLAADPGIAIAVSDVDAKTQAAQAQAKLAAAKVHTTGLGSMTSVENLMMLNPVTLPFVAASKMAAGITSFFTGKA